MFFCVFGLNLFNGYGKIFQQKQAFLDINMGFCTENDYFGTIENTQKYNAFRDNGVFLMKIHFYEDDCLNKLFRFRGSFFIKMPFSRKLTVILPIRFALDTLTAYEV